MEDLNSDNKSVLNETAITELGLRTRTRNALLDAGISTVGELISVLEQGDGALTNIKGLGPAAIEQVKAQLAERGIIVADAPQVHVDVPTPASVSERPIPEEVSTHPETVSEAVPVETVAEGPSEIQASEQEQIEQPSEASAPAASTVDEAATAGALSLVDRLQATLAHGGAQLGALLLGLLGLVLVIVALFLPPLRILDRLGVLGYSALSAADSSVSHPDGLTLSVDPETFTERVRVKLGSVPRLEFLEGSAGNALRKAVEGLPGNLVVKSPYYEIAVRGTNSQPVTLDVSVPNDAEPWHTLDLYTWDGTQWQWVGSELHAEVSEQEFIRAQVSQIPQSIVVVQTAPADTVVSAYFSPDHGELSAASGFVDEINPIGLLIGTDGGFAGDLDDLIVPDADAAYRIVPSLRNWAPGASVNRGLLLDVLTMPAVQEAHIENIVQLCSERGFAGIEIDYQGVNSSERDTYTAFVGELADALHRAGLRLNVVLPNPIGPDGALDTTGYDWQRIGATADLVKVPFPNDPGAYGPDGEAHRLIEWATSQVARLKLQMLVSSLSMEISGDTAVPISLQQALEPFGQVVALSDLTEVKSGAELEFALSGRVLSITPDDAAGTVRLEYEAQDGQMRTVWLGASTALATKARWAQDYHLAGLAVADPFDPGNASGIWDVIAGYGAGTLAPVSQPLDISWVVASSAAAVDQQTSPLTEPGYTWAVSVAPGDYTVKASIAGFDHGSVSVRVIDETVAMTPTQEITTTEEVTATEDITDTCLSATYVADVTIPDNTRIENGEEFTKTWRVRNNGTCAWPEDTVLAFASDAQMGAPDSVSVGVLEPGEQTEVSVKMTAPDDPGRYAGVWQMQSADGRFGGSLTVVIQAGAEAEAATPEVDTSVPIAPVSAGAFELGGHIRNVAMPYADKMHYAGMNWAKVQVHYGQDVSGIVNAAHSQGFKIQLSALGSPGMVTQPGFENDFANWVAQLAAAGADAIEVWNEPNIDREWQIGHISPQAYTNLLCTSYRAIKNANPNVAVISAAPAPTGYFGGCGPNGCDDQPWIAGMRDAGAANCMDFLGAHHNSGATSPSATSGHPADPGSTHHSWFFLPQTRMYFNTFGGTRKLFYTEMGYASQEGVPTFSDAFAWARGTTNAQQAQWLAEAVRLSVSSGMVRCIIVWNIDFVRYGYDPQDGYAIIRPDGSCPACETLHATLGTR
ncbi:MAG: hypothetical protein GX620_12175 [Chloroflexi bacterium]|nr:hypothetical protein [Chloroflexota bacterium]